MAIRWGARMDGEVYGSGRGDAPWDSTTWNTFEQHTGKKVSLVHWGQPFGILDLNACNLARNRNATSLISIGLEGTTLKDIAAGNRDSQIEAFASKCQQFGSELLLRLWWEMNGTDWGFNKGWYRNTDYVPAWRHFYGIVRRVAPSAKMVWCPNAVWDTDSRYWLAQMYPGDAYVDWVGIDGYNFNTPWKSPGQVFNPTLEQLNRMVGANIPYIICETGCTEKGGSKANWIHTFLTHWLPKHRRIIGFTWFNWNLIENGTRRDWQIESSPSAQEAFRKGIANSYFK